MTSILKYLNRALLVLLLAAFAACSDNEGGNESNGNGDDGNTETPADGDTYGYIKDTNGNPDNDPRGIWTSVLFTSQRTKEERPNLSYELINPYTKEIVTHPVYAWKYSKDQYLALEKDNRLYWGKNGNLSYPRLKRFLCELDDGVVPVSLWSYKETGTLD